MMKKMSAPKALARRARSRVIDERISVELFIQIQGMIELFDSCQTGSQSNTFGLAHF
jgi:hypothetical protein